MEYDAFISYSHERDRVSAQRLRRGIQQLGRQERRGGVRIFLDESGLSASPALWSSIAKALDSSRFLILLASPEAAQSAWVDRELRHWLVTRSADTVLQVLTGGDLVWDHSRGDFDTEHSNAIPPALLGSYREEPRYVDLKWAGINDSRNSDPRFRLAAAQVAAPLLDMAPERLADDDVRAQRRTKRRRGLTIATVAVLVVAVAVAGLWAADRSRRLSEDAASRRVSSLAQLAVKTRNDRPDLAPLLALEASNAQRDQSPPERTKTDAEVRSALWSTVVTPSRTDITAHPSLPIVALATSNTSLPSRTPGRHEIMASLDAMGTMRIWDLGYGSLRPEPIGEITLSPGPETSSGSESLTVSPDASAIAVRTARGVEVVSATTAGELSSAGVLDGAAPPMRFSDTSPGLVADRTGNVWDLACIGSESGCGTLTPVWRVPDEGVQFADLQWGRTPGVDAVVWADTLVGTTIGRHEWALVGGPAGFVATRLHDASFSDDRCGAAKCRLLSSGSGVLLDIASGPRSHTLSLAPYRDRAFVRLPAESQVPYKPIGAWGNPRGVVPRQGELPSDRYVLMAEGNGSLYTQAADLQSGIGTVDTRVTYRSAGDTGMIDSTGTYLVGGDDHGVLHVYELAPGQAYVNAGIPEAAPAMSLEGTDLVLRSDDPSAADCCDLTVGRSGSSETMQLGHVEPTLVGAVECGGVAVVGVRLDDRIRIVRFPDGAATEVAATRAPDGRTVTEPGLGCGADDAAVLVAATGAGLYRVSFGDNGAEAPADLTPGGCCAARSTLTLTPDGRYLMAARRKGQGRDSSNPDLTIWDLQARRQVEPAAPSEKDTGAPTVVALTGDSGFLVARGTTLEIASPNGVGVRHLADAGAPIASIAVRPDGREIAVGTSSTVEVMDTSSGRPVGEPMRFAGTPLYGTDGRLYIHATTAKNRLSYSAASTDTESLRDRACALVAHNPSAEEWAGITDDDPGELCVRDDGGTWHAVDP